jgi:hypothetical protein
MYCKPLQTGQNIFANILPISKHNNMLYFGQDLPPKSVSENCQFWTIVFAILSSIVLQFAEKN